MHPEAAGRHPRRIVTVMADLLRAHEAAELLGITTTEMLQVIRDGHIRTVMVDGVAHVPADAIDYEPLTPAELRSLDEALRGEFLPIGDVIPEWNDLDDED